MRSSAWSLLALFLCACSAATGGGGEPRTLYEGIGGKNAVAAVVEELVLTCLADVRFAQNPAKSDPPTLARVKGTLVRQICALADGPCEYSPAEMRGALLSLGVTTQTFDHFVEALARALDRFKVGSTDSATLLRKIRHAKIEL